MKFNIVKKTICLALAGLFLSITGMSAQTFVRFVVPSDLGTKPLFSDDVLPSITLLQGVSRVDNNRYVRDAAFELADVLRDPDIRLLSVYVCGSASPDGLWQNNVNLSGARTEAAAEYLRHVTGISMDLIQKKSLNEDWDRLYELVEASDIDYRDEVLYIIKTKDWGDRKAALQKLAGGRVWRVLLNDFFPQLRCIRIAFYCLWDPSKPYMKEPEERVVKPIEREEVVPGVDTVYVRDTVYYIKETVYIPQTIEIREEPVQEEPVTAVRERKPKRERPVYETPWMMGFKTNLVGDAIVVPTVGTEFQIGNKLSLDLQGFYTNYNSFNTADKNANVYGFSPEIRFWPAGRTMRKGQFVGIHARCAWYTMEWKDNLLYQNGPDNRWEDGYLDAGNLTPAWSAGLTYGYSLGFGKKGHWGLEFLIGVGYANYKQNIAALNGEVWEFVEHQDKHHFGITRAGVNLTYRFSLRKVNPEYYEKK